MDEEINTRDRIVRAATRLFQLKGYHATGLNEILRESNAPKGSLYYYFPNGKEELALESIELTKVFVEETIRKRLSMIEDPAESIKNAIQEMADFIDMEENEKISFKSTKKVSVNLVALETSSSNENLRKACESAFDAWQNVYAEKLIQGGFTRQEAQKLSMVIQSMIEGAIVMSLTKKSDVPFFEVAETIPSILRLKNKN
ncbi:TetR/AcrR family transcriptional regulator [Methanobacterium paludis]|uniref:Regulatory protein TetR n=1 Tax=Methanobacterium paludis (strain DSM 25820 / JCM 18151 / SWAN1) TaxID=868131 RepID=F6D4A0_METPW|nr:TetR/AcrR family transcriptional regulator [Methanobacterium paludis]AEG18099.1 regulatory protein TetR [Methanobacterium paludis]